MLVEGELLLLPVDEFPDIGSMGPHDDEARKLEKKVEPEVWAIYECKDRAQNGGHGYGTRGYPLRRGGDNEEDGEFHEAHGPSEAEEGAHAHGDALAAMEVEEGREDVAADGSKGNQALEPCHITMGRDRGAPGDECREEPKGETSGKRAFSGVKKQREDGSALANLASDVRGSDVAGAYLLNVNTPRLRDDLAKRYAADKKRDNEIGNEYRVVNRHEPNVPSRALRLALGGLFLSEPQTKRSAFEIELLAKAIFKVALVVIIDELREVAEERNGGRTIAGLVRILDAKALRPLDNGVATLAHLGKEVVECARGHLAGVSGAHAVNDGPDLLERTSRERGYADDRSPGSKRHSTSDGLHDLLASVVIGHKIPLIEQDDKGTSTFDGKAGNLLVLLGDALGGIDDKQTNLRLVDGAEAPNEAVVLDVFVNEVALAHASGVDEAITLVATLNDDVEGVACRAGDVAHDGTILTGKAVGDRGLADVRTAR